MDNQASQMNNEATLREKAREAIQSGKLPAMKPSRTWGGPGSGTECSVCGEPVKPDQMELEIEYRNGGTPDVCARSRRVSGGLDLEASRGSPAGLRTPRLRADARWLC